MWMRLLALTVVLQAGFATRAAVAEDSLHLSPIGTVVSGSFDLAGKPIPLPAGEFVLAATERQAQLVSAFVAQLDGQRLKSAVWASTVPEPAQSENRLLVEQRLRSFGPDASGLLKDAAAWLAYHDVLLPVPILSVAEITRSERRNLVRASYAFNPWSYGCNTPTAPFVESVTALGKAVQQHFDDIVMERQARIPVERIAAGIHQCASALASRP